MKKSIGAIDTLIKGNADVNAVDDKVPSLPPLSTLASAFDQPFYSVLMRHFGTYSVGDVAAVLRSHCGLT